jgi:hypothetical protein
MATMEAKVKSVLSGDTVILHNISNPKQERTLSLAYVMAPRMRREGDEVRLFAAPEPCSSFPTFTSFFVADNCMHAAFCL